jgi:uncharacterized membrane protein
VERRRRWAKVGVSALAVAAAVPAVVAVSTVEGGGRQVARPQVEVELAPAVTADCDVTDLARPDTAAPTIATVDPSGQIIIGDYYGAYDRLAVWRDRTPSILTLPGVQTALAIDVNSAGEIVGRGSTGPYGSDEFGFVYRNTTLERLAVPPGYVTATGIAINKAGDVVGSSRSSDPPRYGRLTIWRAGAYDAPQVIEPDVDSFASDLADDGTIVGTVYRVTGGYAAAVWSADGTRQILRTPSGWTPTDASQIHDDLVYGVASRDLTTTPRRDPSSTSAPLTELSASPVPPGSIDKRSAPIRWNRRTGNVTVFPTLTGGVHAASATGWFAATMPKPGTDLAGKPVLVSPAGQVRALPLPDGSNVSIDWISDDGRTVIGHGQVPPNDREAWTRSVVWTCR